MGEFGDIGIVGGGHGCISGACWEHGVMYGLFLVETWNGGLAMLFGSQVKR